MKEYKFPTEEKLSRMTKADLIAELNASKEHALLLRQRKNYMQRKNNEILAEQVTAKDLCAVQDAEIKMLNVKLGDSYDKYVVVHNKLNYLEHRVINFSILSIWKKLKVVLFSGVKQYFNEPVS